MAIAVEAAARHPALDEVRLRLRGVGNRIARLASIPRVALAAVVDEGHRGARRGPAHADVRDAVRRRTEVGMRRARPSNEVDVRIRPRIDRRAADLLIPPVVWWKELPRAKV